ncbi:VanW family protein [uncultured Clostridium sp.]|uniref:VanW family protein n=1 Tax=uncultured Clostridium sp. TaxID=59620 RepID=UPI0025D63C39|nr:VanW family protein [uncultured Clostridium sp.]
MENGSSRRTASRKGASSKKKKIAFMTASILMIVVCGLAAFWVSVSNSIKKWDNKIYPGVTVQNINLVGMTKDEAKVKLKESLEGEIDKKVLPINIEGKIYELKYADISPSYDVDTTVDEAVQYGKDSGLFEKYLSIKGKRKNEIGLAFSYDENKLKEFEESIIKEVNKEPVNASINIVGDKVQINPEEDGIGIDVDTLDTKIKEALNGDINSENEVDVEAEVTKAKITSKELSKVKDVMGSFSTSYGTSAAGRSHNIELATKSINGTIVMPGETFSFNDVVGPRTEEAGFQEAGTYVGNKVEPGIGGGICQVSTTLYRAVMRANIRSTERTNHSMAVGYALPGLDATVAYGYLDYKFKNTYDFPIYIQGYTAGKVVTYNIYGDTSALDGKTYDMVNEILETIPPETKIIDDPALDEGTEVNEGGSMIGYRASAYQVEYQNGVEVSREKVSTDTYTKVDSTIRKGTKPVTPAQPESTEEENAPENEQPEAAESSEQIVPEQ